MALVQQRRTVEKTVHVCQCDGPECNVEEIVEYSETDRAPRGWLLVRKSVNYYATRSAEDAEDEAGPWHFHRMTCLLLWARKRASPQEAA